MSYPPYTITSTTLKLVAAISERLAVLHASGGLSAEALSPQLRRENRIRTIHASLAIENNTLSMEQVTDIIDGKPVMGPPRDIQEVRGAVAAYEKLDSWKPHSQKDLLAAHALLMHDLVDSPGKLRTVLANCVLAVLEYSRAARSFIWPRQPIWCMDIWKNCCNGCETQMNIRLSQAVYSITSLNSSTHSMTAMAAWGGSGRRLS